MIEGGEFFLDKAISDKFLSKSEKNGKSIG
jgi:hypothetical protein